MPDITQIAMGNQIYDLKDAAARDLIATTNTELDSLQQSVGDAIPIADAANFANADQSKIYIYTGDDIQDSYQHGHWYWYNGSAWTDGGVWGVDVHLEEDGSLTHSGYAADAQIVGDRITDIRNHIETIIGNDSDITETTTINETNAAGVIATYENGKIKAYGTPTGTRRLLCLNGQNASKSSTGVFNQTLPAGRYIVHIKVSGYRAGSTPWLTYTHSTFGEEAVNVYNNGIIDTDSPVMVGLPFTYNVSYGTSDNPTYYDIRITPVKNKQNKLTFDPEPTEQSTNPVTSDGIYTAILNALSTTTVAGDNVPIIPNETDFNTLTTPGTYKIASRDSAETMVHIPVKLPCKLFVISLGQLNRLFQIHFVSTDKRAIYLRFYDGEAWNDWVSLVRSDQLSELASRVDTIGKKVAVRYESGTWGDGVERLNIYVPATEGYIMYRMYHYIDTAHNCDCWQISHAYHCRDDFGDSTQLTVAGEWESAVTLGDRDDSSGGHTHGDEVIQSITMLMDGKPVDMTTLTSRTYCQELKIIRTSKMYDPADHTTAITDHGVEYVFNKEDGLTINQSMKWLVAESLANCFMAMFLPSKNFLDRASANNDFEILSLASSTRTSQTTIVKHNANKVEMWDTESGLSASVSVPVYPTGLTGGDQASISDNGGLDYNKLYFKVCGGGTSTIGELWKSTTVYKLDFVQPSE